MKRKSLVLLMTIVICIGCFAGISTSAFSDVTEDHVHNQAITYLTEKGVINGYEDGTFKPGDSITRAEFAKMLLESFGFGNVYGEAIVTTGFTDVDAKTMTITTTNDEGVEETNTSYEGQHWAAGYIKLAVDKGIVNGYGDGTFGPDDSVKYEEAIKMIVCCLGRESHAKTRAESVGMPLWPDGYLSIGNDLMITKTSDYQLGANASRSNVAQMLYNVKDVQMVVPSTVVIEGDFSGGSIGSGNTTSTSDLKVRGTVVASYKQLGEELYEKLILDDSIVINGSPVNDFNTNYIIVKYDGEYVSEMDGETYGMYYTNGADYSSKLAHHVEVKYTETNKWGGRKEIKSITTIDTNVINISAEYLKPHETEEKYEEDPTEIFICYTDGDDDYDQSLYTSDLDTLNVIYNNRLIDVEALGDGEGIDIITIPDLMPVQGSISIINADDDNSIELIWVNSYETYVVGGNTFSTAKKEITDKFRKDGEDNPLPLVLYDSSSPITLNIKKHDGTALQAEDVKTTNTILSVAKSKCETNVSITKEYNSKKYIIANGNAINASFVTSNNVNYQLSEYYKTYVAPTLQYESDDELYFYLDTNNRVVWAEVKEPTYLTGYLMNAYDVSSGPETEIVLDILTSSGTLKERQKMSQHHKLITKDSTYLNTVIKGSDEEGNPIVGIEESYTIPTGKVYRNLEDSDILEVLEESAEKINSGKSADIVVNATYAQPIRYTEKAGEISTIVILELDETNKFTGTSMKYSKRTLEGTVNYIFTHEQRNILAEASSTFVFVPNDRSVAIWYKIGAPTSSAISEKLVEYMQYNAESYYTTDISGNRKVAMVVFYNENIDSYPTYRSENIIVTEYETGSDSNGAYYQMKGYVGGVEKTYRLSSPAVYTTACVLDENFERTNVYRSVEVGDVVRVGKNPQGLLYKNIEIIFDISEQATAPKVTATDSRSNAMALATIDDYAEDVYYYARIGQMTGSVPDGSNSCTITLNGETPSTVLIGSNYSNKQIILYDLTVANENNRFKTNATMGELYGNEMLFVWQGQNLAYKQIYAVRYPVAQP